jgi:predicted nucleotidyltransferase
VPAPIDDVLLRPGSAVSFRDRDDLLEALDRLGQRIPGRAAGRKNVHREHWQIVRFLRLLASSKPDLLPLPVTLTRGLQGRTPDFLLEWPGSATESVEVTEGTTAEYQARLTDSDRRGDPSFLLLEGMDVDSRSADAAARWADILFETFLKKARHVEKRRYDLDHLLMYDGTGLGLLVPLEEGGPLLAARIQSWYTTEAPAYRFKRVSVLRDRALLLDITGTHQLLSGESPYFSLPVVRAESEEDLKRRLRELDRYCREHSIRHLKPFGSILGDREGSPEDSDEEVRFRPDSDLDLLVEFEPTARINLLDMGRMERELSELIGFRVDLRTRGDLSRFFRETVLRDAVELHADRS